MNAYANAFYCAHNADKNEVIINFAQEYPVPNFSPIEDDAGLTRDTVAGVILNAEVAKALSLALQKLIDGSYSE